MCDARISDTLSLTPFSVNSFNSESSGSTLVIKASQLSEYLVTHGMYYRYTYIAKITNNSHLGLLWVNIQVPGPYRHSTLLFSNRRHNVTCSFWFYVTLSVIHLLLLLLLLWLLLLLLLLL